MVNKRYTTHFSSSTQENSFFLELDTYTLQDLEIFSSGQRDTNVFNLCNLTRTDGGERVLRRRMEYPWSRADHIRGTQLALSNIMSQRDAYEGIPSSFATSRVELYIHDSLPMVMNDNWLEFTVGAYSLWATHDRHYFSILQGVQITCKFICVLKRFVQQHTLSLADGELAVLIDEVNTLLDRPKFETVPERVSGLGVVWKILRLDRDFRVLEADTISRLLELVYEIDALIAMTDANLKYRFVTPVIEDGALCVKAEDLIHPYVDKPVANPVTLDDHRRGLFLTGANMAGKTTYLRAFATAVYLAHLGMGVPAKKFHFVPVEKLFSSISLSDNVHEGVSYFRAEALRVKAVAQALANGDKVISIMDEPFKGTNVQDTLEASIAILKRFSDRSNGLFMFSSHQIELRQKIDALGCPIDCRFFSAIENEDRLRFDYLLRSGVSTQKIGMRVLREEGVFDILDQDGTQISLERKAPEKTLS